MLAAAGVIVAAGAGRSETGSPEPKPSVRPEPSAIDPTDRHRWDTPRRGVRSVEPHPDDWNPLAGPFARTKRVLQKAGITLDVDVLFFDQWASDSRRGQQNFGTFAWRTIADWELLADSALGDSYLEWNLTGTVGLNYDAGGTTATDRAVVGVLSVLNSSIYPDPAALDELLWKQVLPGGRFVASAGRIDQSYHFDVNRVANDSSRKFLSYPFTNNPSIPWPLYGGVGGVLRWNATDWLSLLVGAGDSSANEPWAAWKTVDDGSWYQLVEADVELELPSLGKGQYRVTPWHNHLGSKDGWGIGVNFDQELGLPWLVGFFRFGAGDRGVTPVRRFVSGGVGIEQPFGRAGDYFGLGAARSVPSDRGLPSPTFIEIMYRLQLTPTLELSPDLQVVIDPANDRSADHVFVPGIRLLVLF